MFESVISAHQHPGFAEDTAFADQDSMGFAENDIGARPFASAPSQKGSVERPREEHAQPERLGLSLQIDQDNFDIATEFPENLPASPAGRSQHLGIGDNHHAPEAAGAL